MTAFSTRGWWWRTALLVSASAVVGCAGPAAESSAGRRDVAPRNRSVLLVTLDTLRPDRLEPYGATDVETPHLARLAERGVVFENAYAVAPITLPSHTSILTGLYPPQHGVRNNGINYAADGLDTVTESLRDAGYRTGAFVSAAVLDRRYGLAQGFDTYDDRLDGERKGSRWQVLDRRAGATVAAARSWLDGLGAKERFFAWVHLFDPHAPYDAPEPYASRYRDHPYDGEVAYLDSQIGRLLEHSRLGNDVVILVVGDHGESLGAHDEDTHGILVYDSTLRVPWILSAPGTQAGLRIEEPVSQVDIVPTLLELLGLDAASDLPGRSLASTLRTGGPSEPGALYAESYQGYSAYGWARLHALVEGRWKFHQAPTPELFNLEADPGERSNLAAAEPDRVRAMERRLAGYLGDWESPIALDTETEQALRSLGYVAASRPRDADDSADLPDPKDLIGLHDELLDFFDARPTDPLAVVAQLERFLDRDPGNLTALRELPPVLAELGRFDEAVGVIGKARTLDGYPARIVLLHSRIEQQRGDLDKAETLADEALTLDPRLVPAWIDKVSLLLRTDRAGEARRTLETALELFPDTAWFNVSYAQIAELPDGDFEAAEARLRRALDRDPFLIEGYRLLADLLVGTERVDDAASVLRTGLERAPDEVDLHSRLGLLLVRKEPQKAATHLRQAIDRSTAPRPDLQAALEFATASPPATSGSSLAPAAPAAPGGRRASDVRLAASHLQAGRLDQAEAELKRLLQASPGASDVLVTLAALEIRRGNLPRAEGYLVEALEANPREADTWNDLGLIVEEQGRVAEARSHYRRALDIDPDLLQPYLNLGVAARKLSEWEEAADLFEEALRRAPGEQDIHLELGALYGGPLGRGDLARKHYDAFLRAAPSDPRAETVREQLRRLVEG